MPSGCEMSFKKWWKEIPSEQVVEVRYPHQRHGLSGRASNRAKSEVKQDFLEFVDTNSQPNGRSEESSVTHYYLPKFTTIQT